MSLFKSKRSICCAVAALLSVAAQAQIDPDFSNAFAAKTTGPNFVIGNISYQGRLYQATLNWNPYDARFDIARVEAASGNARVCNIGNITINGFTTRTFNTVLTVDATARSITAGMTLSRIYNGYGPVDDALKSLFFSIPWTIVQNGREVYTSTSNTNLTSTQAYVTKSTASADLDWIVIPSGSQREVTINNIPTYINLSLPLTKLVVQGVEYPCQ